MRLKNLLRSMIGESSYGRMEYFLKPKLRNGRPLNGQAHRQRIFSDIVRNFPLQAIVETGAFRGTTTSFFSRTGLPVYAVEINPRFYSYCERRFRHAKETVYIAFGDSRAFLNELRDDPSVPKRSVFFYLDAHWSNDLPLRGEVEIIFSHWEKSVVMIDDFRVPGTDYGFDEYGPGKTLDLDYLMPVVSGRKLAVFFPSVDQSQETGWKRGTAVLCQDDEMIATIEKFNTLRRYPVQAWRGALTKMRK